MKHYQMPLKTCVSFIDQIIPRNMSIIYCKTTWSKMNDFERKQYVRKITNKNEWTFVSNVWSVEVHSASLRLKRKPVSVNSAVSMMPDNIGYREEKKKMWTPNVPRSAEIRLISKKYLVQKLYLLMCIRKTVLRSEWKYMQW